MTDEQPGRVIDEALSATAAGLRIALEQWDKEARELRGQIEKLQAMNRELEAQILNREIRDKWEAKRQPA